MTTKNTAYKPFNLGQIVATPGALRAMSPRRLTKYLCRHGSGDWGVVCTEDAAQNDQTSQEGFRIFSAYPIDPAKPCKGHGDNCLWIITEADRSVTTFLLPEEY